MLYTTVIMFSFRQKTKRRNKPINGKIIMNIHQQNDKELIMNKYRGDHYIYKYEKLNLKTTYKGNQLPKPSMTKSALTPRCKQNE